MGALTDIGPFTVIEKLGDGGFGIVWLAEPTPNPHSPFPMALLTPSFLAVALSFSSPSSTEIRASFHADAATWAATDVVVVSEGEAIDGRVTVIETWIGVMEPGTELTYAVRGYRIARYSRLMAALRAVMELGEREVEPALAAVVALDTVWGTRPELVESSNFQVVDLCERIRAKD